MPRGALTIVPKIPKPGEPGSGHVYIVAHRDGRYAAACWCLWPYDDEALVWRDSYEQVRADWDKHAEEMSR